MGTRLAGTERWEAAQYVHRLRAQRTSWTRCAELLKAAGYYKGEGVPTHGFPRRLYFEYDELAALYGGKAHPRRHEGGGEQPQGLHIDEYTFTDLEVENVKIPRFDGEPHIYGDCIVTGDFQLPTTDYEMAERVLVVGRALGIKTLLIVGDWVNMDAFSKYDHIVPPIPFATEVQVSVRLMERYARWFDDIWLALGNHEHRLLKLMKGDVSGSMLGRLLSAVGDKLHITPYSHIIIHSGGQTWRATHQVNYSKIKGRVGDELAQKYQMNILTHHQHHAAKLMDRYGRYVIIDNGGLFDADKMAYVKLRDSTSVGMTKGFTVLLRGTGHLLTPYPAFTDFDLWLSQARQLVARAGGQP